MIRVTSRFWVDAYRRRLENEAIPCFVSRKGDETAGAIFVKLCDLQGSAQVFQRSFDLLSDTRRWQLLIAGDEPECDAALKRQIGFDQDLWIIEVEDRQGRHFLDDPSLS